MNADISIMTVSNIYSNKEQPLSIEIKTLPHWRWVSMLCKTKTNKTCQTRCWFARGTSLDLPKNELGIRQNIFEKKKPNIADIIIFKVTSIYPDDDIVSKTFGFSFFFTYIFYLWIAHCKPKEISWISRSSKWFRNFERPKLWYFDKST